MMKNIESMIKLNCAKIIIFVALCTLLHIHAIAQVCTMAGASIYPQMGLNFSSNNATPTSNLYLVMNSGSIASTDAEGWPAGGNHLFWFWRAGDPTYYWGNFEPDAGTYKIYYKGTCSQLQYAFMKDHNYNNQVNAGPCTDNYANPGYAYFQITTPYPPGELKFEINGPIKDIQIMRPNASIQTTLGYYLGRTTLGTNFVGKPMIDPRFEYMIRNFKLIRYMYWCNANNHSQELVDGNFDGSIDLGTVSNVSNVNNLVDWNERTKVGERFPTGPGAYGNRETNWEQMIECANQLKKDMWINIPIKASDNYIDNLALLLKDKVDPDIKIYIEIGNELWNNAGNFMGPGLLWQMVRRHYNNGNPDGVIPAAENNATNTNPANFTAYQAGMRWPVYRTRQIMQRFSTVWGMSEINNRLRGVVCGQWAYGIPFDNDAGRIVGALDWLANTYGEPAGTYLYGVGMAPYAENTVESPTAAAISNLNNIINNNIYGEYDTEQWCGSGPCWNVGNKLEGYATSAKKHGMRLVAYEGNNDFSVSGGGNVTPAENAAVYNAAYKPVIKNYFERWFKKYGYDSPFCYFNANILPGFADVYGISDGIDNPNSIPLQAVNEIATTPIVSGDPLRNYITTPGNNIFDARKVGAYAEYHNVGLFSCDYSQFFSCLGTNPDLTYLVSCKENGRYRMQLRYANGVACRWRVVVDGTQTVVNSVTLPATGSENLAGMRWSYTDQGVDIQFDLTYGFHSISLNSVGGDYAGVLQNYSFQLLSANPPAIPALVTGDLEACAASPKSGYSVSVDQSVCQYQWAGLPAGASILPYDAGGSGIPPSGQGYSTMYINWGSVPNGTYNLTVFGINAVGTSPGRVFSVLVTTCGFTISPLTACTNSGVSFSDATVGSTYWGWDLGPGATPASYSTTVVGSKNPPAVIYATQGLKTVKLTVRTGSGQIKEYFNTVNIQCNLVSNTADITTSGTNICSSSAMNVGGVIVSGTINGWNWNFGAGATPATASGKGPHSVSWSSAGVKIMTLTAVGGNIVTNSVVTVIFAPAAGTLSSNGTSVCLGGSATLSVTGGNGLLNWYRSTTAGVWLNMGLTGSSITVNPTVNTSYMISATGTGCIASTTTSPITILVNTPPLTPTISYGSVKCNSSAFSLSSATNTTGGIFLATPTLASLNSSSGNVSIGATPGVYNIVVSVVGTGGCSNITVSGSTTLTILGTSTLTSSISVSNANICSGTGVSFTASGSNLGVNPTYNFLRNGFSVQNSLSNFYINSNLSNNDVIRVIISSSGICLSSSITTSTGITITVSTNLTPTVSITASQANICSGTGITFVATPTNGGTPTYQWKLNGANTGTSS
ncbi:MAG: hypothetical protein NW207_01065, partial [Cytophagales bacterium]|nr:hypothetical protein [Cytophagales bacterium]